MSIRVIGVGQYHRGDDAVGLVVANRVRALAQENVEVFLLSSDAMGLLSLFAGQSRCVVIDSARGGGVPGTVLLLTPDAVGAIPHYVTSSHGNALAEAVALGAALNCLPRTLRIVAIVGAAFGVGQGMTGRVVAAISEAVTTVQHEITALARQAFLPGQRPSPLLPRQG